jgi:hypothetical protein
VEDADARDPPALQRRGIPSQLLVFPDENHCVPKLQNSVQWHARCSAGSTAGRSRQRRRETRRSVLVRRHLRHGRTLRNAAR